MKKFIVAIVAIIIVALGASLAQAERIIVASANNAQVTTYQSQEGVNIERFEALQKEVYGLKKSYGKRLTNAEKRLQNAENKAETLSNSHAALVKSYNKTAIKVGEIEKDLKKLVKSAISEGAALLYGIIMVIIFVAAVFLIVSFFEKKKRRG